MGTRIAFVRGGGNEIVAAAIAPDTATVTV
jgi:hypothetical protein